MLSFNQTTLELKFEANDYNPNEVAPFNQTTLELKHSISFMRDPPAKALDSAEVSWSF